jgi:hypothetical protein
VYRYRGYVLFIRWYLVEAQNEFTRYLSYTFDSDG